MWPATNTTHTRITHTHPHNHTYPHTHTALTALFPNTAFRAQAPISLPLPPHDSFPSSCCCCCGVVWVRGESPHPPAQSLPSISSSTLLDGRWLPILYTSTTQMPEGRRETARSLHKHLLPS
ncbi:hypothetical protein OTU49_015183 [Cherax quadricarinatus]|uniref:Uncharacterized protein n=1 Tax=Cherax quadricarinatus TaxID=27406 RepID=A0AAW0YDZ0_CHEQU